MPSKFRHLHKIRKILLPLYDSEIRTEIELRSIPAKNLIY